jgi:hypothetical protein
MWVRRCRDCKGEITDIERSCPHCGADEPTVPDRSTNAIYLVTIILCLLLLFIIGYAFWDIFLR